MAKDYHLRQTGQEVQDILDKAEALDVVSPTKDGLMSKEDKTILDDMGDDLTYLELEELLNL